MLERIAGIWLAILILTFSPNLYAEPEMVAAEPSVPMSGGMAGAGGGAL